MTKKLTRIGMIAVALAVALALVLTACGGNDDPAYPAYGEDTAPYLDITDDPYALDPDAVPEPVCYCDELEDDALCSVCQAELDADEPCLYCEELGEGEYCEDCLEAVANDENDNDNENDENDNDNDNDNDEPVAMPQTNAQILAEYARVMQAIKDRQPSYTSINYQTITNANQLPADVMEVMNEHFFVGGSASIIPEFIADSRALVHPRDARANPDRREHYRPGGQRVGGGQHGSSARWIGVSPNDAGSLANMSHVRNIAIRDLGNDRRQIDITIVDARNPAVIAEGATAAPNAIAAFMEVQDIAEILEILEIGAARTALRLFRVNLTTDSFVHYSGSTIRVIYNPRTMEAESVYKIGRMTLNFDGTIRGIEMSDHPIRIDAVFDFNSFDWGPAWPS